MKKIMMAICVVFITQCAVAQIETDRPDFTESPNVVPKGALQIETGFILENDKESVGGIGGPSTLTQRNLTVNTSLFRFGLTDKVELRLYTVVNSNQLLVESGLVIPDTTIKTSGFQTSFIGFKTNLYKSDKMSIGFLGHLYIPELASGDFAKIDGQKIAPEFLIPLTYDITDRLGIAVQYGLSWDGFTPNPTTSYTLSLGYGITDKLSAFVEPYGFLPNNGDELHLINGGFTYLINDDFQVDLTGGFGLNEAAPDNFINCGASFLLFNK
jgi:hypothetical protein